MSAGFKVAGEAFWGTNGAVEAYVETMASIAAVRFGPDDPLTAYLAEQRDGFSMGRVLFLDEWLTNHAGRDRLLELLEGATGQLLREGQFVSARPRPSSMIVYAGWFPSPRRPPDGRPQPPRSPVGTTLA